MGIRIKTEEWRLRLVGTWTSFKVKEKNSIGNENQILGTSKYGRLIYQVSFEKASDRLQVTVVGCQDLKVMDISRSSDPYVIVHLPNTAHSNLRTRTEKKCLSPVFHETFAFQIP